MNITAVLLSGGRKIDRFIARLESGEADEYLEAALVAGALVYVNAIKRVVPVKSGTYKRSWHVGGHTTETPDVVYATPDGKQVWGPMPPPRIQRGALTVFFGTGCPYGKFLEWGTSKMAARPDVRTTLDDSAVRARAIRAVRASLKIMMQELKR